MKDVITLNINRVQQMVILLIIITIINIFGVQT